MIKKKRNYELSEKSCQPLWKSVLTHKGSSEPVVHCGFVLCSSMDVERHVLNVPCLNNTQLKYLDGKIFAYAGLDLIKIG